MRHCAISHSPHLMSPLNRFDGRNSNISPRLDLAYTCLVKLQIDVVSIGISRLGRGLHVFLVMFRNRVRQGEGQLQLQLTGRVGLLLVFCLIAKLSHVSGQ